MPSDITVLSTSDLLDLLIAEDTSFTPVQIGTELKTREVPSNDSIVTMRGGTRPQHVLNP